MLKTDQIPLELVPCETFEQAKRAAFRNCRGLKKKSYEEVMQVPYLARCIEIMAGIRIKRQQGLC